VKRPVSRFTGIAALVLAASVSHPAFAQFTTGPARSTGTTSAGMFGTRTVGGARGVTAGARSFAGGGRQQTLGQQQQFGGGQAVLSRTLQNQGTGGLAGGQRFMRQNRAGQFVGSDVGDVAASLRTLGGNQTALAGLNALTQQLRGNQGRQQRSVQPNQANGVGGRGQQPVFRVSREVAFDVRPATGPAVLSERLTQLVQRSRTVQAEGLIEVQVRGRTAILRGSVATDRSRELAARLVLLEPGVDQVDNQLQVAVAEPSPE